MAIYNAAWAIPLLPLLGALLSFGVESQRRAAQMCVVFSGLSFIVAAILLGGWNAAQAQGASAPCALVCFPPAVLNAKKCSCEAAIVRKPVCSLVCLNPDETLDARRCACVRRP